MSCIVYQTNKKTGEKYAYESISYWDKEKKQPRSKRKYIGKVDPITGEIIQSRKDSASLPRGDTANDSAGMERLREGLARKDSLIESLRNDLRDLTVKYNQAVETITKISVLAGTFEEKPDV